MTTLLEPAADTPPATATPRVLGLDLSITAPGICLPDGTTQTIKTNPKDCDKRLNAIVSAIGLALGACDDYGYACDLVVIEEAPPGLKGPAIKAIHMVHGAVRLFLNDFGLPYIVINPTTLKRYATGKSGADKTAMAMAAYKRANAEFADDNQCDAAWLRWAGLDLLGHAELPMPADQRAALDAIVLPKAVTR